MHSALQLLLSLVKGIRSEILAVDPNLALADAEDLYRAGEGRLGTNEDIVVHILTTRSPAQLKMALEYYRQTFGHDFEKVDFDSLPVWMYYRPTA